MTMTVKLGAPLEQALRSRCASLGLSASAVIREALQSYLAQTATPAPSAYELGKDLFGLHAGPEGLSSNRKAGLAKVWAEKEVQYRGKQPVQTPKTKRG